MKTDNETEIESWSEIDWKLVNSSVKKLRRRIFDARKYENYRKLRSLQLLMLNSTANILFSIRKTCFNSGREISGIDGETLESSMDRIRLFNDIRRNKWNGVNPKPIRRIYIREIDKLKPIGIPVIYDRVIQQMVSNSLEPEWEAVFEKGSYGFRPKRNVDDAVSRVWLSLCKKGSSCWILDADISKCVDRTSHKHLLNKLRYFPGVNLIRDMLEVGIIIREVWMASEDSGTFKGSVISPLLCNIIFHGIETDMGVIYNNQGYGTQEGFSLIRFADALVILCKSKELAYSALETLKSCLLTRGMEISQQKTKIVHILEGFDFLGYNFKMCPKRYSSKDIVVKKTEDDNYSIVYDKVGVYVTPSRKSITKVKSKLKFAMTSTKGATARKFIEKINPIIRGYSLSKLHWHSNKAFRELDHYVHKLCWRWAIRKHAQKGSKWIRSRYFKHLRIGYINNKWAFSAYDVPADKPFLYNNLYVLKFYWFKIKYYLMGKMDKVLDNRLDSEYFYKITQQRL
jgi:RNA-directed DNA polymerase